MALGTALVQTGRYEDAKKLFLETIAKIRIHTSQGGSREDVFGLWYDLAGLAARAGRRNEAFGYLNNAIEGGYTNARFMRTDDVLKGLRTDVRFEQLVARAKAADPQPASASR